MKQKFIFTLACCLLSISLFAQYVPDILGDNYLQRTINMPDDYEGEVVCTLVKKPELDNTGKAILYIHGYNDYFFQKQLGDSANAHDYNFYALDLRKYGRSIRPNQDPFYCKSLNEYFADIDTALALIRSEGNDTIFLMAHSTGGLITPYYLNEKEKKSEPLPVDGLILNSPFLNWNFGWGMQHLVMPAVSVTGKFFPDLTVQGKGDSSYSQSLLKQYHGQWEYDTNWKMFDGHPKKAGWIRAIQEAQQSIQPGANINCPILVLSSNQSFPETAEWNDQYLKADIVLNIDDIQKYGALLGNQVTRHQITDGIHDLILSEKPARDEAYQTIFEWLKKTTTQNNSAD